MARQRVLLGGMLDAPLERLAQHCAKVWPDRDALENLVLERAQPAPYLAEALAGERFSLSDAYLSRNAKRVNLRALRMRLLTPRAENQE